MASKADEDLCCVICQDIYKDPVLLSCSHSFCKACLQNWWSEKPIKDCPVCKKASLQNDPPRNLALKNICEAFLEKKDQKAPEPLCSLHSEKLKLFCLDHRQPVCVVCRDSKIHNDHKFRPIDEAARDYKEALQKSLKPLQKKLKLFKETEGSFFQIAEHIKVQAQDTEKKIKEQFKTFHQFLQKEEQARIRALREEERQKSQRMKEKMTDLSRKIAALLETIRATEEELKAQDVSFLMKYQAAVVRVQLHPLLETQLGSGALLDQAKHLGNLGLNIWNKMKEMVSFTPVVLDPNSAGSDLVLSADLTEIKRGKKQNLPDHPERLTSYCVLGSQGFNSGTHSWEVNVGDNKNWTLGVARKSVQKEGLSEIWRVGFCDGAYSAETKTGEFMSLSVQKQVQRITVNLDFNRGKLSFHDSDTNTLLCTFKHTFNGDTLFPYIYTEELPSLKVLPLKVFVTVKPPS